MGIEGRGICRESALSLFKGGGEMVHNSRFALRESRLFREISCAKVANRRESFEK